MKRLRFLAPESEFLLLLDRSVWPEEVFEAEDEVADALLTLERFEETALPLTAGRSLRRITELPGLGQ